MLPLFPTAFVLRPVLLRLDPSGNRFRVLIARWVSLYAHLTPLYRFTIEGTSHLPKSGPYVLVANHESGLDVLTLLMLGVPVRFLAETWMFKIPLAGWLFRSCRHIPVKPGDRESGRRALETAEASLDDGIPVGIFPEGKLSPDELAEFKPGAFVLSARKGVPIVPVCIEGTGAAWRPGTVVVHGAHQIRITVLDAIEPVADDEPSRLSERTREALLAAHSGGSAALAATQSS